MGSAVSKDETAKVKDAFEEKYQGGKLPQNDYQLVFEAVKDLEYTLQLHFESSGDHLHEMIGTANREIPQDLIFDMRALATVRNSLAHEYSFQSLQNRDEFIERYRKCVNRLSDEISRKKKEDDEFYNDVVQKHRAKNPLPKFVLNEDNAKATNLTGKPSMPCPIVCY
jgi:uncharacterized protein YutE (UPF0331/DUF86 family)